jgi:hypothetical protein
MIWPHEHFCQISKIFLVQLNYINRVKEWWWWWWIWLRFVRFQNGVDLHINSKSPLGTSLLVNLVNISDDGQHKSCSLSYGLG